MTEHDLLHAVQELTRPTKRTQRQDIITDGHITGTQKITIVLPSLLDQMTSAIRSSIGGTAGGATLAHERAILDTDALFKLMKIASQIRDWCVMAKIEPTGDPGKNLDAWYVSTLKHPITDSVETHRIKQLGGWAGQIRAKLDPWREYDLPYECPLCGAKEWWKDGQSFYRPLIVRFKPTGPNMIQEAQALCRFCDEHWNVRELAYLIEQHTDEESDAHAS